MSTLFKDANGNWVQTTKVDWTNMTIQNVTVGAASAATTNVVPADCTLVRIISTTACWYKIGSAPTAAADNTSIYLPANVYVYEPVRGGIDKLAFIQNAAGGTAQVIPGKL